jgi:hypothetical protein
MLSSVRALIERLTALFPASTTITRLSAPTSVAHLKIIKGYHDAKPARVTDYKPVTLLPADQCAL